MGKIISISGTHCTGKTTLVEALKKRPELQNAVFLKSSGRALAAKNPQVKVNEDGNFYTQLYQMARDVETLLEVSNEPLVICDRSYIDTYIYSLYLYNHGKLTSRQMAVLQGMADAMGNLVSFDKVFLLRPSFELQNEVNRSMNKEFQTEVYNLFDEAKLMNWDYLPDNNEERIKTIVDYVTK